MRSETDSRLSTKREGVARVISHKKSGDLIADHIEWYLGKALRFELGTPPAATGSNAMSFSKVPF